MIGLLVRIDARRPASWIAAAAAAAAIVAMANRAASPWLAVVCGGLLAAAAVGDPADLASLPCLAMRRVAARWAWPAAGILAGFVAASWIGRDWRGPGMTAAWAAIGLAAALAFVAVAAARGGGWWSDAGAGLFGPGGHEEAGRLGWLDGLAMASTLAAMAACYFLAPQFSGWYAILAAAWFVVLFVPRATITAGDAFGRIALVRSAVGSPRPPGVSAHAIRGIAAGAAILGWPAVVAASLWGGPAWSVDGPLAALALLAALAAVAVTAVRFGAPSTDTPSAAVCGLLAVAIACLAQVA